MREHTYGRRTCKKTETTIIYVQRPGEKRLLREEGKRSSRVLIMHFLAADKWRCGWALQSHCLEWVWRGEGQRLDSTLRDSCSTGSGYI